MTGGKNKKGFKNGGGKEIDKKEIWFVEHLFDKDGREITRCFTGNNSEQWNWVWKSRSSLRFSSDSSLAHDKKV